MPATSALSLFTTEVKVKPTALKEFALWQAHFNETIASQKGFVSLEILNQDMGWYFVQRFDNDDNLNIWKSSAAYKNLLKELNPILACSIHEKQGNADTELKEVTEIFITEVSPDKVSSYRKWIGKIHQLESLFPGFKGVYVQSPQESGNKNWITLLRFDNEKNLNHWLESKERHEVLKDSESIVDSIEKHTIVSPYSGWFSSLIESGKTVSAWKQAMLVLLVLFPIIVLEIKYLNPSLSGINPSVATFIGNALSVALITWPGMPIAISGLKWWLTASKRWVHYLGFGVVIGLYLLEIALLWNVLIS